MGTFLLCMIDKKIIMMSKNVHYQRIAVDFRNKRGVLPTCFLIFFHNLIFQEILGDVAGCFKSIHLCIRAPSE